ncbi:hypothetical protein SDC9_163571 [bioreactor metagenome]|uniref:Uncharacterized protein n=1 Tax=bioreactor metagenome TaxID=1076179 RepID=A0A645FW75_9ZZZZ
MLAGAGFGDQFFLAHIFCKQAFAHAVIELMCTGVVEIFPLQINLTAADLFGESFTVIDRCRSALKFFSNSSEFIDKLGIIANLLISFSNFFKSGYQFRRQKLTAIFTVVTFFIWKFF